MSNTPLTVYYDGLCPLCSREIDHYRARAVPNTIAFVDITDPSFDARAHGLDPVAIHRALHVRTAEGRICTHVEAFCAIWETIPSYRGLARLVKLPGVHQLAQVGYAVFARLRPWLPRRKRADCASGFCVVGDAGRKVGS